MPQDDRFYAVIEHADPKALLVATDARAPTMSRISPRRSARSPRRRSVSKQRAPDAIGTGALTSYSLLVIADTGALSDGGAAHPGICRGRRRGARDAGREHVASDAGPLLEGWRIGEPQQRAATVGEIATTHPVLRDAGDWHRVRFFRHRTVAVGEDDKVLIAYEDGTPLLIERTIGAGRMLVLTAPVERSWNDLAIHPLFVHFIAEAARYLMRGDASAASTTVGSVVMTGLTAAGGGQIFDPQGRARARPGADDGRGSPDSRPDRVLRDPRQRRRRAGWP